MGNVVDAVYIHIPFCNNICNYCDFCKVFYNKKYVDKYIDRLHDEIKANYKNEVITTLYIGGGTPSSLSLDEISKLFGVLKIFNLSDDCEITFEANVDSLTEDKVRLLKEFGVNRVSIGVQTFNRKLQKFINREIGYEELKEKLFLLRKYGINNINLDLMYAFVNEDFEMLKGDLDLLIKLDVPHISTYSLIIEEHTKLKLDGVLKIDEKVDRDMYDLIRERLKSAGYNHYEISNFAKSSYEAKHNLKYWQNKKYYGFGVGASSYIDNIRYTNTKSIVKYLEGERCFYKEVLSKSDEISYEVILNLRTCFGINKKNFKDKFTIDLDQVFNYKVLVDQGILIEEVDRVFVRKCYFYVLNEVIIKFLDTLQTNV